MLKQLKAGLSALEDALGAGFEDFKVTTASSFEIILLALDNLGGSCESITCIFAREFGRILIYQT